MSDKSCRTDSEFELHFRQSLLNFEVRTPGAGVSRLLSALWQQVVTVLQVKAARSITSKPHGGASLGAGNSELKCDDDVAHPDEQLSEVSIRGNHARFRTAFRFDLCMGRVCLPSCMPSLSDKQLQRLEGASHKHASVTSVAGQEREARTRWKEDAGTRSGIFQIRDSGSSSITEPGSRNLQPLMAGGKECVPLAQLPFVLALRLLRFCCCCCDFIRHLPPPTSHLPPPATHNPRCRYGFETSVSHMIHRYRS